MNITVNITANVTNATSPIQPYQGSMDTTVLQSIFVGVSLFSLFIITPLALYYSTVIWSKREDLFFDKRMPKLSIACLLTGILQYALQVFAYLPIAVPSVSSVKYWVMYGSGFFVTEGIRAWFMYFSHVNNLQSFRREWGDSITSASDSSWAAIGKWYSPRSNVIYIMGVVWMIMQTILHLCLIRFEMNSLWASVPTIIIFVVVTVLVCIMQAYNHYTDGLHIRAEFKYHGLNVIMLFLTVIGTDAMLIRDEEGELAAGFLAYHNLRVVVIRMVIISISYTVFCYISTGWLLRRYKLRTSWVDTNLPVNMKETLEGMDKFGFELFALHLINEHSVNNLLFVLEVSKLKAQLLKHGLVEKENLGKYLEMQNILTRVDNTSSTTFDGQCFYRGCKRVMEKYIEREGKYAVTMSASSRRKVLDAFEELDERRRVNITLMLLAANGNADGATQTEVTNEKAPRLEHPDDASVNLFLAVIDMGLQDVWHLLENDGFARFQCTTQFKDHKNSRDLMDIINRPDKTQIPV